MPKYNLTSDWSQNINVAAGAILQVQSPGEVEVYNIAQGVAETLRLPGYLASLQVTDAITIKARATTGEVKFAVIAGF